MLLSKFIILPSLLRLLLAPPLLGHAPSALSLGKGGKFCNRRTTRISGRSDPPPPPPSIWRCCNKTIPSREEGPISCACRQTTDSQFPISPRVCVFNDHFIIIIRRRHGTWCTAEAGPSIGASGHTAHLLCFTCLLPPPPPPAAAAIHWRPL